MGLGVGQWGKPRGKPWARLGGESYSGYNIGWGCAGLVCVGWALLGCVLVWSGLPGLCWAKLCCARLPTKTQVSDGGWRQNRRQTSEQRAPESLRGRSVVAPPFGFARPWSLRGRSVGALWWWAYCLFKSVRKVGLSGFSRPRARSFSRSQGMPRVGLGSA